jgi:hypothetical protein
MASFETFDEEGVIALVPGPTSVDKRVLQAWSKNYASPGKKKKLANELKMNVKYCFLVS